MPPNYGSFWEKYIANVQLDLSIAAYTKVPASWNDDNYVPDFNKLYFIIEGEGYVKIEDRLFLPRPGQLFLLPAGVRQSYGTISGNTFGKYWCHFTAKIGDLNLFDVLQTPVFVDITERPILIDKFEQLIGWLHRGGLTSRIRLHAVLLEIIALFIEHCGSVRLNTSTTAALEKINTVLHYIEEHLSENMSVEELAQLVHFHPNYFIRVFKNTTGLSPIQYVNRMRVEKAKHLLSFTRLNVSAVADRLGMELPYFSRMFKENTGLAPTDYRVLLPKNSD